MEVWDSMSCLIKISDLRTTDDHVSPRSPRDNTNNKKRRGSDLERVDRAKIPKLDTKPDQSSNNAEIQMEIIAPEFFLDAGFNPQSLRQVDFHSWSIEDQLNLIADALSSQNQSLLSGLIELMQSFNSIYDRQSARMSQLDECGHSLLINSLAEKLKLIENSTLPEGYVEFRIQAIALLGLLARNAKGRDLITSVGGLDLVISQMRTPANSPDLFQQSCFALGNLISTIVDEDGSLFQLIEKEGLIETVIKSIKMNLENKKLLQTAFFALGNLVSVGDFELLVHKNNGIQIALEASKIQFLNEEVLVETIFFLKNMTSGETGCELIVSNSGIPFLASVLKTHANNSELVQMVYNLVSDLSFSSYLDELVIHCGSEILNLLRNRTDDPKLSKQTLNILSLLYSHSCKESRIHLLKSGLIEAILQVPPKTFISFHDFPSGPPSLMEISGRCFLNSGQNTFTLCPDLQSHVANPRRCNCCGKFFFDYYFELLSFGSFPGCTKPLPQLQTFCSSSCLTQFHPNVSIP